MLSQPRWARVAKGQFVVGRKQRLQKRQQVAFGGQQGQVHQPVALRLGQLGQVVEGVQNSIGRGLVFPVSMLGIVGLDLKTPLTQKQAFGFQPLQKIGQRFAIGSQLEYVLGKKLHQQGVVANGQQ